MTGASTLRTSASLASTGRIGEMGLEGEKGMT